MVVTIKDQSAGGKITHETSLLFTSENISVKDLIEARVREEVRRYNESLPEYFQGLVQPTHAEKTLNGYHMRERKKIDAEKQVYIALDAFMKNGFFILIDNKQAESLDQNLTVSEKTSINFVRLTPLVGG